MCVRLPTGRGRTSAAGRFPTASKASTGEGEVSAVHIGKDLVAASATPLVLGILAEGESYGYAILKRVHELSGGRLDWTDGMLYPLLHRLERLGYVSATWGRSDGGRRRRLYVLTSAGREALGEQRRQWAAVTDALREVWHETSATVRPGPPLPVWGG